MAEVYVLVLAKALLRRTPGSSHVRKHVTAAEAAMITEYLGTGTSTSTFRGAGLGDGVMRRRVGCVTLVRTQSPALFLRSVTYCRSRLCPLNINRRRRLDGLVHLPMEVASHVLGLVMSKLQLFHARGRRSRALWALAR